MKEFWNALESKNEDVFLRQASFYLTLRNSAGLTPLGYAVFHGLDRAARALINSKADVNERYYVHPQSVNDRYKVVGAGDIRRYRSVQWSDTPPIVDAVANCSASTVKLLLDHKATIYDRPSDGRMKVIDWNNDLINAAVANGKVDTLKVLMAANANTKTPLIQMAKAGWDDGVRLLIEAKANIYAENTYKAESPFSPPVLNMNLANSGIDPELLCAVVQYCKAVTTQILIDKKPNIETANTNGDTLVMVAARAGKDEAVALLLDKKASIHAKNADGDDVLLLAASYCTTNTVRNLIDRKADVNAVNKSGETPLIKAAAAGKDDAVRLLLERNAKVNAKDNKGTTALLLVVNRTGFAKKDEETVKSLLTHKADVNAADDKGMVALLYAARNDSAWVVHALIDAKANLEVRASDWGLMVQTGDTPLWIAMRNNKMPVFHELLDRKANVEVETRVNNYSSSKTQQRPLAWAATYAKDEMVAALIKNNAKLEANSDGGTALHNAANGGHVDTARLLMQKNAEIEARNEKGLTPLGVAVDGGRLNVVELLVAEKADINAVVKTAKEDTTLLKLAEQKGFLEIARVLERKQYEIKQGQDAKEVEELNKKLEEFKLERNRDPAKMYSLLMKMEDRRKKTDKAQERFFKEANEKQEALQKEIEKMRKELDSQHKEAKEAQEKLHDDLKASRKENQDMANQLSSAKQHLNSILQQNKITHQKIDGVDANVDDTHDTVKQGIVDQMQRERDAHHAAKTQKQNSTMNPGDAARIALQREQMQRELRPGSAAGAANAAVTTGSTIEPSRP